MMNKKLYDLWMEAVVNYSATCLCNDDIMLSYYLGQVHILADALDLSGAKLKFWWKVFDDCQKITCE